MPIDVMKMMENRLIWLGTMSHITKPVWNIAAIWDCAIANALASKALTSVCLFLPVVLKSGCSNKR